MVILVKRLPLQLNLTQIDTIAQYPIQLYGANAIIGVFNAIIVTAVGLVINVTGMATPIAGAVVLFGFNKPIPSIIGIVAVAITSIILGWILAKLINKINFNKLSEKLPGRKTSTQAN